MVLPELLDKRCEPILSESERLGSCHERLEPRARAFELDDRSDRRLPEPRDARPVVGTPSDGSGESEPRLRV